MSNNKSSRASTVLQDKALIAGTQKYLMGQSLIIGKQTYAPQDIINVLLARVSTGQAIIDVRTALTAAIKADLDERSKTRSLVRAFCTIVQGMFDDVPDTLAVFGLKPRKSSKKTVAVKSDAIAKSKATRKARGTMGKKQRLRIKGYASPTPVNGAAAPAQPATAPKPTA
jgi:hypothetical protein